MRDFLWIVSVCVLYLTTAKLGLAYAVVGQTVTLFWPPSGIALAATLMGGYRVWPGIALGALIANAGTDVPLVTLSIITLGNTLEPLIGSVLLKRQNNFSNTLDKVSDVLALALFGSVVSTIVSASFGILALFVGGEIAFADIGPTCLTWWLGDGLGIILVSPILLTGVAAIRVIPVKMSSTKAMEALALLLALTVVGQAIFGNPRFAGLGYFPVSLSMFPFAIWSALRFGTFGAASVALLVSLIAIHGTAQGTGPFATDSAMESLIRGCVFADIMAITGLLLGTVSAERAKALATLKSCNEDLEERVRVRTEELTRANQELQKALTQRRRLEQAMNEISEARLKMIGQELHDGLGQQLTGISFMVSSLIQLHMTTPTPEIPAVRQIEQFLGEAIAMVRSLSRGLYPVALETGGLASALNHLAGHAHGYSGIQCDFSCTNGLHSLSKTTALNLYRIAQEAVSNALRHSQAQRIDIRLSKVEDQYVLSVEDNGNGFRVQNPKTNATLGLRSMQCRADLIGAAIEIRKNQDGGTSVLVTGPINSEGQDLVQRIQ